MYRIAEIDKTTIDVFFVYVILLFVLGLGRPSRKASAAGAAGLRNPPPSAFCILRKGSSLVAAVPAIPMQTCTLHIIIKIATHLVEINDLQRVEINDSRNATTR